MQRRISLGGIARVIGLSGSSLQCQSPVLLSTFVLLNPSLRAVSAPINSMLRCVLLFLCLLGRSAPPSLASETPDTKGTEAAPEPPPPQEKTWQIQLDRPASVGQSYTLSATGTQERRTEVTSPTQPGEITTEHLTITYAGIHEIKATDKQGRPAGVLIRIDRLTTDDGSGPIEQLAAGTLVTATASGNQTRYQMGREELDGTLADALNLAGAKLPSSQEPSEDAVFLNHIPRRPGDRWTADPKRLADAIAATTTFLIDPVTSTGEIQFDQPVTENGIPSLATTATFHIAPIALRDAPDQNLSKSSITSITVRIHPVDPSLPLLKEELKTDMKIIRRAKSGPQPAGSETTFKREVTRRYHPLPAAGSK